MKKPTHNFTDDQILEIIWYLTKLKGNVRLQRIITKLLLKGKELGHGSNL